MKETGPVARLADDAVAYKQIIGIDDYNKTLRCTYFLVVLFTEGSGTHYIDDREYAIGGKQLHFLYPGQHHHWVTGPETFAHKVVVGKRVFELFSGTDEFQFMKHNLPPVFRLSDPVFEAVTVEMECIERDLRLLEGDDSWKKILQLRMDLLASMMKRQSEGLIKEVLLNSNPVVTKFWDLVTLHFQEQKNLGWYAGRLAITSNYLNILCRRHLNVKATELIQQKMVQEAKSKLRYSDNSVKEIAFYLGFRNVSAFSSFFKKKTGFSPSDYRKP